MKCAPSSMKCQTKTAAKKEYYSCNCLLLPNIMNSLGSKLGLSVALDIGDPKIELEQNPRQC